MLPKKVKRLPRKYRLKVTLGKTPMELVAFYANILENENPAMLFLDNGSGAERN